MENFVKRGASILAAIVVGAGFGANRPHQRAARTETSTAPLGRTQTDVGMSSGDHSGHRALPATVRFKRLVAAGIATIALGNGVPSTANAVDVIIGGSPDVFASCTFTFFEAKWRVPGLTPTLPFWVASLVRFHHWNTGQVFPTAWRYHPPGHPLGDTEIVAINRGTGWWAASVYLVFWDGSQWLFLGSYYLPVFGGGNWCPF
jgi:hypothetical protein